jgi:hypothetical protein
MHEFTLKMLWCGIYIGYKESSRFSIRRHHIIFYRFIAESIRRRQQLRNWRNHAPVN